MVLHLARGLLKRYPVLRSTWPVQQASAWRLRQSRRAHPRRMASWYRDALDMRTRVFVSNLELPEAPQLCEPTSVLVTLLDQEGLRLTSRQFALKRNASLVLEVRDLLPAQHRGHVQSGQITLDFGGAQLGSSRAYLHWYNDRSLTSSHEKFGLTIPAVGGYWTVPNVQDSDEYRVFLAVANLDTQTYISDVTLKDDEGHALDAQVELPPNGSRFLSLETLFQNPRGFLHNRPGVLYFGNNRQPAMYYYFVQNQRLGTWRAQHL
ncbi:MAG: hypothetical protein E6I75_14240 [Chloroflexi bacterium]|nr:MAG: hypothetical protein E6I75_14240 [Chloroflexota bacterium]